LCLAKLDKPAKPRENKASNGGFIFMNIFVLDENPIMAAQLQVDKHVVKMCLETAQLLSTAHHLTNSIYATEVYRKTHANHPCAIWVRESRSNYQWLLRHFRGLLEEYTYRYEKIHKSSSLMPLLSVNPINQDCGLTPFALAMPDEYKTDCAVQSYRNYYINEKHNLFAWKKRNRPEWTLTQ
jgi:hypothetical protein